MERTRRKAITLTNSPDKPLTEKEIVDATLAFANGAKIDIRDPVANPGDLAHSVGDKKIESSLAVMKLMRERGLAPGSADNVVTNIDEYRAGVRAALRRRLAHSLRDRRAVAREFIADGASELINPTIVIHPTADGLDLTNHYSFSTFVDLIVLGEVLLLATSRDFRHKLCQCQWEPCGLFFFEIKPPTGRPQRKYCGEDHMLKAHDLNAAGRMKKSRSEPRKHK
jgi:hypothetical protein